ncbi:hypothetical protein [Undibacterium oligocarboniphilum]|uniref:Uncharacterized protein n=1 Tax=Undibacterium oligocarboniphilum TaxID=666702 RepID=A0A850QP91_9BURK|nr:hypothetical protein [Undibacterium oligocarboniphilum]MBC3871911.1 hypothetical protein [Undibacterium oligocarboniphilum]NVO79505.1 hypothetical protein [Undibacterium oligocarboniphilum]
MELAECFNRFQGEQRKSCVDAELRRLDAAAIAQAASQAGQQWLGHPMDLRQVPEPFQRAETKHADFVSIWGSDVHLGRLPLIFSVIGVACLLFLVLYLLSVAWRRFFAVR